MERDFVCEREKKKAKEKKRAKKLNEDESEGFSTLNIYDIDRKSSV